ncbi:hypothetical protein [Paeniglutamicibacter terrestris]|uniref:DUF445 family protein n=1 Tax=Paeniglutamicibacter terrestris TaxID=2723403 RepID=A0ABX1G2X5_9MICC|nr:hypothetical protein [Paeniglutamicibacter terrestris]NKG20590.1 hypothetical protein [Paeniglutamicibacter terrestris]
MKTFYNRLMRSKKITQIITLIILIITLTASVFLFIDDKISLIFTLLIFFLSTLTALYFLAIEHASRSAHRFSQLSSIRIERKLEKLPTEIVSRITLTHAREQELFLTAMMDRLIPKIAEELRKSQNVTSLSIQTTTESLSHSIRELVCEFGQEQQDRLRASIDQVFTSQLDNVTSDISKHAENAEVSRHELEQRLTKQAEKSRISLINQMSEESLKQESIRKDDLFRNLIAIQLLNNGVTELENALNVHFAKM